MNCSFMYLPDLVCHLVHHFTLGSLVWHAFSALAVTAKFISKVVSCLNFDILFFKSTFSPWNLEQV